MKATDVEVVKQCELVADLFRAHRASCTNIDAAQDRVILHIKDAKEAFAKLEAAKRELSRMLPREEP